MVQPCPTAPICVRKKPCTPCWAYCALRHRIHPIRSNSGYPKPHQYGTSLLEILIAIVILAVGLLGVAAVMANALQWNQGSGYKNIAQQLANDYSERMRNNIAGVTGGNYNRAAPYDAQTAAAAVPACADARHCNPGELAAIDQAEWRNALRKRLPGGAGYARYDSATRAMDVWILWQEPDLRWSDKVTLSVARTGGDPCPAAALSGWGGPPPSCLYFRSSL